VHLNPTLDGLPALVDDASSIFERTNLGQDMMLLL